MHTATWALALLLTLGAGCASSVPREAMDPAYLAEIETWHAEREAALAAEDGWLTLVGLLPIAPGAQTLGSGPDAALRLPPSAPRCAAMPSTAAGSSSCV